MGRLDGKVALVTGGALGIGAACARRMMEAGARVAIVDVLDEAGQALAHQLGEHACYLHADVAVEAEVAQAVKDTVTRFGHLDVLVNNAGISGANKPTHELSEAEWDRVQAINVKGVDFCTKRAIGPMRNAGGGSIINLSSIYGLVGAPDVPPYHASKGAVRLMTKTDALLYAADRIRVNSIHPGFIWTPMLEAGAQVPGVAPEAVRSAMAKLHPLRTLGEPDDVAHGILYLASDEAKFVTGSELVIDGGYTAR